MARRLLYGERAIEKIDMTETEGTTCSSCGRPVLSVRDAEGGLQVLDRGSSVYHVQRAADGGLSCKKLQSGFVVHSVICPGDSGSREKRPTQARRQANRPGPGKTRLVATGRTYDNRDTLKSYGFRWNFLCKEWEKVVSDGEIDQVVANVHDEIPDVRVVCDIQTTN